jgi:predicted dehydrogenase
MAPEPIRIAIIGAGAMGREHGRAFAAVANTRISGLHSRTRTNAEALAHELGVAEVHDTVEQLFERTHAQLVVVAVPELAISPVLHECLRFPWTIFMEKPVGYDLADGEAIAAAAKAAGARIMVGLNRRFLSSTSAALDDLRADPAPRFIHVQDQQSLATARIVGHPDLVVCNWMYANSIHLVDYLIAFGRGAVSGVERVVPWRPEAPGLVLAKVSFTSGDLGLYEGIWDGPGPWACTVTTGRRRWEMRPLEQAAFQNAGERVLNSVEPHRWDRDFKPGFRLQAERVIAALFAPQPDVPELDEAMRTMRLIHDIFAA